MTDTRTCARCGQVMLTAETDEPTDAPTCESCKGCPTTGHPNRLFDAPQTIPGQMALE